MSRSFKKHPYTKDRGRSKRISKRFANKAVRKTTNVPNGKSFKKCFSSWDICDWKWGEHSQQLVWEFLITCPYYAKLTEKELQREFYKMINK